MSEQRFIGTDKQLCSALRHMADNRPITKAEKAIVREAADRLTQARREALEEAAREDFLKPLIIEQSEGEWADDLVAKDVALFQRAIRALIDKEGKA